MLIVLPQNEPYGLQTQLPPFITLCCYVSQEESELSAAFSELGHRAGRLEPVLKPSRDMLDLKERAFANGPEEEKLVEHVHSGVDIARKDIRTLKSRAWLNDEVMNVYMGLLQVSCWSQLSGHSCFSCYGCLVTVVTVVTLAWSQSPKQSEMPVIC